MSHAVPLNKRFDTEHERDRRENIPSRGLSLYWRSGARPCAIDL